MPDLSANTRLDAQWRALALLTAGHAVCNFFLNPIAIRSSGDEFPTLLLIGVIFVQPLLFAMWTAIGPPPATKRVPWSVIAFVLILLAGCIRSVDDFSLSRDASVLLVMPFFAYVAVLLVMCVARVVTRLGIVNIRDIESQGVQVNQFSVKYLLVLTAVCAVLLGIGRAVATSFDSSEYPSLQQFGRFVVQVGIILLAVMPAILIPIMIISYHLTLRIFVTTLISAAVIAWIAIETIILVHSPPRSDVTRDVLSIELGAVLASGVSALVLRFAGYRLVRRPRTALMILLDNRKRSSHGDD